MRDARGIEPIHGPATKQRSWVKIGEILRSMVTNRVYKGRMPILGPAGLVFLDTDGRRSEPCQDQREPHVAARAHFENPFSSKVAGREVEPGNKLGHLTPAIRVALGEIELVRHGRG